MAIVSPWPPAATGVAEYAATIADALAAHYDVERLSAVDEDALRRADRRLYQLGNNRLHGPAYDAALAVPGVVELHDAVLHHFLLGRLGREEYLAEHELNGGLWARATAERLWERRSQCTVDEDFFRYPLLKRVVEASEAVIVHNPAARRRVEESGARAQVYDVPHYVDPPQEADAAGVRAVRERLEVPAGGVLIASFGYQRPTKRLRSLARAVRALETPYKLLIQGRFVSDEYEAAMAPLLEEAGAVRLPYAAPDELRTLLAATDIGVNLRWPTAGETSGILMKLMAAGKAVVVTDSEEGAGLPPGTVAPIDAGELEEPMLAATLARLAGDRELRESMGRHAAAHVREEHSLARAVEAYRRALEAPRAFIRNVSR